MESMTYSERNYSFSCLILCITSAYHFVSLVILYETEYLNPEFQNSSFGQLLDNQFLCREPHIILFRGL
jgi:hypothetical protein